MSGENEKGPEERPIDVIVESEELARLRDVRDRERGRPSAMARAAERIGRRHRETPRQRYERWLLGRRVGRAFIDGKAIRLRLVTAVELLGPPSFFYGGIALTYADGSRELVPPRGDAFVPRKGDFEIAETRAIRWAERWHAGDCPNAYGIEYTLCGRSVKRPFQTDEDLRRVDCKICRRIIE